MQTIPIKAKPCGVGQVAGAAPTNRSRAGRRIQDAYAARSLTFQLTLIPIPVPQSMTLFVIRGDRAGSRLAVQALLHRSLQLFMHLPATARARLTDRIRTAIPPRCTM